MISHGNCQELDWNLDAGKAKYLCISMRGKEELTMYWLKWEHTNVSDSNEIICIISTDNYTLITKIHRGNEHNYVADTMGQWTYYTIHTVVYTTLLLDFMLYESKSKDFLPYTFIKVWKTQIWRNDTRNRSSVVIWFWGFATVPLGILSEGQWERWLVFQVPSAFFNQGKATCICL